RRPTAPPPGPYTPLFRSMRLVEEAAGQRGFEVELDRAGAGHAGQLHEAGGGVDGAGGADGDEQVALRQGALDDRHVQGRLAEPRSEEHTSELQSRENLVC